MNHSRTAEELIHDIERKDRLFRISVLVMITALLALVATILYVQSIQLRQQHNDVVDTKNYIACIAKFFGTTDRANTKIVDPLTSCKVTR